MKFRLTIDIGTYAELLTRDNIEVKLGRERALLLKIAKELPETWLVRESLIAAINSYTSEQLRRNRYGLHTSPFNFVIKLVPQAEADYHDKTPS